MDGGTTNLSAFAPSPLNLILAPFLASFLCRVRDMAALRLKLMVPPPALCLLLLLLMPPLLLPPGCAATRPDPTQGPSEGNNKTCTELSKRNPILYCEHHACVDNCHIEGFAEGGFCNWLRCLCKKPC